MPAGWVTWPDPRTARRVAERPVAVLMGGRSGERDVSLTSGESVLTSLRAPSGPTSAIAPRVFGVEIDGDGAWCLGGEAHSPQRLVEVLPAETVYFLALHGGEGEQDRPGVPGDVRAGAHRGGAADLRAVHGQAPLPARRRRGRGADRERRLRHAGRGRARPTCCPRKALRGECSDPIREGRDRWVLHRGASLRRRLEPRWRGRCDRGRRWRRPGRGGSRPRDDVRADRGRSGSGALDPWRSSRGAGRSSISSRSTLPRVGRSRPARLDT